MLFVIEDIQWTVNLQKTVNFLFLETHGRKRDGGRFKYGGSLITYSETNKNNPNKTLPHNSQAIQIVATRGRSFPLL